MHLNKTMHYKYLTHHVWHAIPPRFELYSCFEIPVETSVSLYQLSDLQYRPTSLSTSQLRLRLVHRLWIYRVNNSDRNSSIHALLYDIMFSLITMLEARIAYSHKSTYIYTHNKLNIMSYNSAGIELL